MARRWQLSLWVLAGLIAAIAGLWDSATVTAVAERVTVRTEAMGGSGEPGSGDPAATEMTDADWNVSRPAGAGSNMLRPTTSTTSRPSTTTTSTMVGPGEPGVRDAGDGADAGGDEPPRSATTTRTDGEGGSATTTGRTGAPVTTSVRPSSMPDVDPAMSIVYTEDFAGGALAGDRWVIADAVAGSVDGDGHGLFRPSSVVVVPDPAAAGGHLLAITARMGSGAETGQVVSGAVRLVGHELRGGRFTIRAKVDPDRDGATVGVGLLRPAVDADATEVAALTWTGPAGSAGAVPAAAWRVYTVDWTADRVRVAVDGELLDLKVDPDRIPPGPMELEIRLDPLVASTDPDGQPVASGEVRLLIDWIRVERVTDETSP